MEERKQILCEFFGGAERNFVENHDPATGSLNNSLDKVESKSCQSVFVGNHNFKLFA
jgi:hypothetical protein